jgi:hypothetical protein
MKRLMINFILFVAAAVWFVLAPGGESREQEISETKEQKTEISGIEKFFWIIGRWENDEGSKISGERWVKRDAAMLEGVGYSIEDGDTTVFEKLKIRQSDGGVFYIADVPHNPGPVAFKLVKLTETEAVFENPEHDFPNRIIYRRGENDTLRVRIEGIGDMEGKKSEFYFLRK